MLREICSLWCSMRDQYASQDASDDESQQDGKFPWRKGEIALADRYTDFDEVARLWTGERPLVVHEGTSVQIPERYRGDGRRIRPELLAILGASHSW